MPPSANAISSPMMVAALFVLLSGTDVTAADQVASAPPPVVSVVNASNECFSASVEVTGFLVPRVESVIRLEPDGSHLTQVLVGEGDTVSAGQVMARLARPTFALPNVAAEAAMRPGPVAPTEAPTRPGIAGEPAARSLSSSAAETARAKSTTTAAAPSPAAGVPGNPAIRAPVAGLVIESTARVGATASLLGEPLFRIAGDGEIEVEVEVPSLHVPILAPGQTSHIVTGEGREFSGRVRMVSVAINPITQLGRARISIDGDASLVPGKFVRATIDARRSCGVAVPRAAISYRAGGSSIQVVHDGVIETRNVRVGLRSDINAEIEDGLQAGDVVVANAGTSLRDGDRVRPMLRDKSN